MSNKEEYVSLINSIKREGFKKEEFLDFLENSDFYSAPASAMYHNAFEGGLVDHCLNVYAILRQNIKSIEQAFNMNLGYSEDTIKIVALCHDLAKVDYYEPSVRNVKVYKPSGSKSDEMGRFDWEAQKCFKRKEPKDLFIYGTHGENSEYITHKYFPLTPEESASILAHHAEFDNPKLDFTLLANKYSLVCLLHVADMMATYIIEKT
jgi:hypothetical protein